MLMDPERTLFVRGATPVLLLADAPVHGALPPVTAADGAVPRCEGWSVVPKLTMCVVDGPGELGIIIPALVAPVLGGGPDAATNPAASPAADPGETAIAGWCEDAEKAGGVVVLCVDRIPEVLDWPALLGSGTARGGFLPALF